MAENAASSTSSSAKSAAAQDAVTANALQQAEGLSELASVGGVPSQNFVSDTSFSTMNQLQRLNPKLYNLILQSIAQNMMTDFQQRQDRVLEAMKRNRENDS